MSLESIISTVCAGLTTSSIKFGVKKFWERKKYLKNNVGSVSAGLAMGYYYNFLKIISDELEKGEISLELEGQEGLQTFKEGDVKICIIYPKNLDASNFSRCEVEIRNSKKGKINFNQNRRPYGINYDIVSKESGNQLIIVDYARPLAAVKFFYEEVLKINTLDNKIWHNAQEKEIQSFKEAIDIASNKGRGTLSQKLQFNKIL